MQLAYVSKFYSPEKVTGRYVRIEGSARKGYRFRIMETETAQSGPRKGNPGQGYTLREYTVAAGFLPEEIEARARATKQTILWDNPNT